MELKIVSILGTIIVMFLVSEAQTFLIGIQEEDGEQLAEEGRINQELLVSKSATAPEGGVERRDGSEWKLCIRRHGSTLTVFRCRRTDMLDAEEIGTSLDGYWHLEHNSTIPFKSRNNIRSSCGNTHKFGWF